MRSSPGSAPSKVRPGAGRASPGSGNTKGAESPPTGPEVASDGGSPPRSPDSDIGRGMIAPEPRGDDGDLGAGDVSGDWMHPDAAFGAAEGRPSAPMSLELGATSPSRMAGGRLPLPATIRPDGQDDGLPRTELLDVSTLKALMSQSARGRGRASGGLGASAGARSMAGSRSRTRRRRKPAASLLSKSATVGSLRPPSWLQELPNESVEDPEALLMQWQQMVDARKPKEARLKEVEDAEHRQEREALAASMGLTVEELEHMDNHVGGDDEAAEAEYKEAFARFDADGSGDISPEELRQALHQLNLGLDDDDIEQMIVEADQDGDGSIDYEEFVRMMKAKKTMLDMARALTSTRQATPGGPSEGGIVKAAGRRRSSLGATAEDMRAFTAGTSGTVGGAGKLTVSGLPPLGSTGASTMRSSTRRKKKSGKKGTTKHGSRSTPRELMPGHRASTDALRRQLATSKDIVADLNEKVKEDVAWVQANCPITNIRAQMFCQKWGFEKMAGIMKRIHHSFLISALLKWQDYIEFTRNKERAEAYLKYKGSRTVVNMFKNWKRKKLVVAWNSWMVEVYGQREAEAEAASIDVQRLGRGFLARRRVYHIVRFRACVEIQRIVRGLLARRRVARYREWKARDGAARYIQNKYRGYAGRKMANMMLKIRMEQKAATNIQRVMRGVLGRLEADRRREDIIRGESAIEIQRVQRGVMGRKIAAEKRLEKRKYYGATMFQAGWRGRQGRIKADKQRVIFHATLKLQSWVRGCWGRAKASERRRWVKALLIQCAWRCYVARCRVTFLRQTNAADVIQRTWRGRQGRKFYYRMLEAKRLDDERRRVASTNIQRVFRGYIDRRDLARRLKREAEEAGALNIQRIGRGYNGRKRFARIKEEKRIFEEQTAASLRIQTVFRGYCGRKVAKLRRAEKEAEDAAKAAALKQVEAEEEARKERLSAEAAAEELRANNEKTEAAVKIQTQMRGKLARMHVQKKRELRAAIQAQSTIRMYLQKQRYKFKKRKHEEAAKRALARKIEEDRRNAAVRIQCAARQRAARQRLAVRKAEYEEERKRIELEMRDKEKATAKAKSLGMTLVEYKRFLRGEKERNEQNAAALKIQRMGQTWAARREMDQIRKILARGKKSKRKPKPGVKIDTGPGSTHQCAARARRRSASPRRRSARRRP